MAVPVVEGLFQTMLCEEMGKGQLIVLFPKGTATFFHVPVEAELLPSSLCVDEAAPGVVSPILSLFCPLIPSLFRSDVEEL